MKPGIYVRVLMIILLPFVFCPSAVSHPHVFVANRVTFQFDGQGMAGIAVAWEFDEFFAGMIAEDYDRNGDGTLDAAEVETVRKDAFANLAQHGYFSFVRIDGKPFQVKYVRDFNAILKNGKLEYRFLIPCHVRATGQFKEIVIAQYDPTYYSAVLFARDNPVSFENDKGFEVAHSIAENPDETYYFDMLHPVEAKVRFRLK